MEQGQSAVWLDTHAQDAVEVEEKLTAPLDFDLKRTSSQSSQVGCTSSLFWECNIDESSPRILADRLTERSSTERLPSRITNYVAESLSCRGVGVQDSFFQYWRAASSERSLPVFEPNGHFIFLWLPTIFAFTIYAVIALPFDLAFSWWSPPSIYEACSKLVDCLFLMDIAIHFNTGIVHGDHIVFNRKEIAHHYATTWLPLDLVSNFPWDWFVGSTGKHRKLAKFLKLPKILRFVRLVRLLKWQAQYVGSVAVVSLIMIFAHYCCCIWVFMMLDPSCHDDNGEIVVDCPGIAGTYAEGLSVALSAISGTDSWTRFIYSSSSGSRIAHFRNPAPLDGWEEAFACVVSAVGFVLMACLFGTVNDAMAHLNARGRFRFTKLKERKADMRQARIPLDLQLRVEATYEHAWMFGDWHDGFLTDEMLSLDLRRNLAYHIYGPALHAVPMFSKMFANDLKCLSQKIVSRCHTPGDLVVQAGDCASEIFMVFAGVVQPMDRQGNRLHQVLLRRGDYFGEICFLFPGWRRKASVICVEFCRLMVITLSAFQDLGLDHLLDDIRSNCADKMDLYLMTKSECVQVHPLERKSELYSRVGCQDSKPQAGSTRQTPPSAAPSFFPEVRGIPEGAAECPPVDLVVTVGERQKSGNQASAQDAPGLVLAKVAKPGAPSDASEGRDKVLKKRKTLLRKKVESKPYLSADCSVAIDAVSPRPLTVQS